MEDPDVFIFRLVSEPVRTSRLFSAVPASLPCIFSTGRYAGQSRDELCTTFIHNIWSSYVVLKMVSETALKNVDTKTKARTLK